MILIHRIERVTQTVLVDGVGRIAGIVPIGEVKRVRWIIGVDRIQRIVRRVSAGGSKDVVAPLIPRIKTHVGIARVVHIRTSMISSTVCLMVASLPLVHRGLAYRMTVTSEVPSEKIPLPRMVLDSGKGVRELVRFSL